MLSCLGPQLGPYCPTSPLTKIPGVNKIPGINGIPGVGSSVANSFLNSIFNYLSTALVDGEKLLFTHVIPLYENVDTPGSTSGPTQFLIDNTNKIAFFVGVVGVLVAGARLALQRRPTAAKQVTRGLVNVVIVAAGTTGVLVVLGPLVDLYSRWIIEQAAGNQHTQQAVIQALTKGMETNVWTAGTTLGLAIGTTASGDVFIVAGIFALIGILAGIAQMILAVIRLATLGLLIGLLPISAAASTTEVGMAMFRKHCLWLFAFMLWKPTASTFIAYGLDAMSSPGLSNQAIALASLILAVFALPAMMRLMNPLVTQATSAGDSGGGAAWGGAVLGAAGAAITRL